MTWGKGHHPDQMHALGDKRARLHPGSDVKQITTRKNQNNKAVARSIPTGMKKDGCFARTGSSKLQCSQRGGYRGTAALRQNQKLQQSRQTQARARMQRSHALSRATDNRHHKITTATNTLLHQSINVPLGWSCSPRRRRKP